ncbi:MAG: hypothetical protein ACF8TS_18920 [Maioricimonas sp. JB049]
MNDVQVTVRTGARLHFGPLAVHDGPGRTFGGIGLMVDRPGCHVRVARAEVDECRADPDILHRVRRVLERFRASGPGRDAGGMVVQVDEVPPAHCGFGSGTQLSLAVARGLIEVAGGCADAATLARIGSRGDRSAIGIHGFLSGGFLCDAGKRSGEVIGDLAWRFEIPSTWRFVTIRPINRGGLSGTAETLGFRQLPPMDAGRIGRLARLVLTEVMPAIRAGEFDDFSAGLEEYGRCVGEYFAPIQGGVFADPQMADLAVHLNRLGVRGVAQTSWGPTIVVPQEQPAAAERLVRELCEDGRLEGRETLITRPLSHGASCQQDSSSRMV